MIGLSISLCIMDVIEGRVDPDKIEKIIGRTATKPHMIEGLIGIYRTDYWRRNPDAAEQLFRKLYAEGKIEQPGLTTGRVPFVRNTGYWVEREDQIEWRNDGQLL